MKIFTEKRFLFPISSGALGFSCCINTWLLTLLQEKKCSRMVQRSNQVPQRSKASCRLWVILSKGRRSATTKIVSIITALFGLRTCPCKLAGLTGCCEGGFVKLNFIFWGVVLCPQSLLILTFSMNVFKQAVFSIRNLALQLYGINLLGCGFEATLTNLDCSWMFYWISLLRGYSKKQRAANIFFWLWALAALVDVNSLGMKLTLWLNNKSIWSWIWNFGFGQDIARFPHFLPLG